MGSPAVTQRAASGVGALAALWWVNLGHLLMQLTHGLWSCSGSNALSVVGHSHEEHQLLGLGRSDRAQPIMSHSELWLFGVPGFSQMLRTVLK